jgi:hypothetical protein
MGNTGSVMVLSYHEMRRNSDNCDEFPSFWEYCCPFLIKKKDFSSKKRSI